MVCAVSVWRGVGGLLGRRRGGGFYPEGEGGGEGEVPVQGRLRGVVLVLVLDREDLGMEGNGDGNVLYT